MVKISINAEIPINIFNVSDHDANVLIELNEEAGQNSNNLGWMVQRIMLDERITEETKLYGIFMLGRMYELFMGLNGK